MSIREVRRRRKAKAGGGWRNRPSEPSCGPHVAWRGAAGPSLREQLGAALMNRVSQEDHAADQGTLRARECHLLGVAPLPDGK